MGRGTVVLDNYVGKPRIPKSCAREVYKLSNKELETLLNGTRRCHGFFRGTVMTLYSRAQVVSLACKKYGCTKKNLEEVLKMDRPPIVHPLIEKPPRKTPQRKKKETPAPVAPPSPPSSYSSSQGSSPSSQGSSSSDGGEEATVDLTLTED